MASEVEISIAIIVGIISVLVAIFERGYKRYLEEKKTDPTIKFDGLYMINMAVTTGVTSAFVALLPTLIQSVSETAELTLASILINAALGYTLAYRILDGLNSSTENKIETVKVKTALKIEKEKNKPQQPAPEDTKPVNTTSTK